MLKVTRYIQIRNNQGPGSYIALKISSSPVDASERLRPPNARTRSVTNGRWLPVQAERPALGVAVTDSYHGDRAGRASTCRLAQVARIFGWLRCARGIGYAKTLVSVVT